MADIKFLRQILRDVLGDQTKETALEKLKENLRILGYSATLHESKVQTYYDIEVYFKKEDCAFQCQYKTCWIFSWWEIRVFDDSL